MDYISDLLSSITTFILGFLLEKKLRNDQDKKSNIDNISDRFRKILETAEKENYSKTVLLYDCNTVRTNIISFCKKYKIPEDKVKDYLIDLQIFITDDKVNVLEAEKTFSAIIRILSFHR